MCPQIGLGIHLGHGGQPCPAGMPIWNDDDSMNEEYGDSLEEQIDGARNRNTPSHLKEPAGADYLTIVDMSRLHFHKVHYCTCPDSKPLHMQLIYSSLFLSTTESSKTAFTFTILDNFIRDNLECRMSASNYYNKLHRITSSIFPHLVPVLILQYYGEWDGSFGTYRIVTGSYLGCSVSGRC